MPRPLFALVLFTLPAFAAPVPKALQKVPAAPQVLDSTWVGSNGNGGTYEYTFNEAGQFVATLNGKPYSKGTWKQDGESLEWEFNNRYAVYTVTFKDGTFVGTANNIKGNSWPVTLKPMAK